MQSLKQSTGGSSKPKSKSNSKKQAYAPLDATKEWTSNYPEDALELLSKMSFTDNKGVMLLGSMALRSQLYAGDYDAYEIVKLNEKNKDNALSTLAEKFKHIIKTLSTTKGVSIGDIKAGTIEKWRVLPRDAGVINGKVVNYSAGPAKAKVSALLKEGIISKEEAKKTNSALIESPSVIEFLSLRKEIRFNVVRWSIDDVLKGNVKLRDGSMMSLEQAFNTPTIAKLDIIGFVQNNKYTDFSMIYEFHNGKEILNPDKVNIENSLKEDIIYYGNAGKPFKLLKRVMALAKYLGKTDVLEKLIPVLNSDLGRLYSISSDLGTLVALVEQKKGDMSKIKFELDQMRARIGNIYQIKGFTDTQSKFLSDLTSISKSKSNKLILSKLESMIDIVDNQLKEHTPSIEQILKDKKN